MGPSTSMRWVTASSPGMFLPLSLKGPISPGICRCILRVSLFIEAAGGFVNSNICIGTGMLCRFAGSLGVEVVANNGLTLSGLVSQGTRGNVGVCFGNIEKYINAALTGKWDLIRTCFSGRSIGKTGLVFQAKFNPMMLWGQRTG